MSDSLMPFTFEGSQVRTVVIDGAVWFVAKDVAIALGYAEPGNAIRQHCRGGANHTPIVDALGRPQQARIIAESDVMRLIVSSKLPAAVEFERLVFEEILPSVRRTGSYAAPALSDDEIIHRALTLTTAKVERLEAKVAADAPKVEYVERHVDPAGDALTFRDAAAHLQVGEKAMREALVDGGWIYRLKVGSEWSQSEQQLVPRFEWRARSEHAGKFSLRAQHNAPRYHNGQVRQTLYVLAGGLDAIGRKLARAGVTPLLRALAAVEDNRSISDGDAA